MVREKSKGKIMSRDDPNDVTHVRKVYNIIPEMEDEEEFQAWFSSCLNSSMNGMHPFGSALRRDLIRNPLVKNALKKAWQHIIVEEKDPDDLKE
jgi:hypothetical protein